LGLGKSVTSLDLLLFMNIYFLWNSSFIGLIVHIMLNEEEQPLMPMEHEWGQKESSCIRTLSNQKVCQLPGMEFSTSWLQLFHLNIEASYHDEKNWLW